MEKRFEFLDWKKLSTEQQAQGLLMLGKNIHSVTPRNIQDLRFDLDLGRSVPTRAFCALDKGKVFAIITGESRWTGETNELLIKFVACPLTSSKKDFIRQTNKSPLTRLATLMLHWGANQGCTETRLAKPVSEEAIAMMKRRNIDLNKKLRDSIESRKRLARRKEVRK